MKRTVSREPFFTGSLTEDRMELFQTDDHYIIYDNEYSLWCSRKDGHLEPKSGSEVATAWNPVCLGVIQGVLGKIQIHRDGEWQLLLITGRRSVGVLYGGHEVSCITSIAVLPLSKSGHPEIEIEKCPHHHFGIKKTKLIMVPLDGQKPLAKTINAIKSATQSKKKEVKEREKHERRVLEEIQRMFADSDSYYYSPTGDLTNSLQRQHSQQKEGAEEWDERFFWNQYMLQDLLDCKARELASHWIVPVIQGYVQITKCILPSKEEETSPEEEAGQSPIEIWLTLISRRSKYRAGTRYRRRGIDEAGNCANFVETEQILQAASHAISYIQIRGSVPVFWSQPGIKYRPPPRIDRDDDETQEAFRDHFEEQMGCYKKVAIVTLLEQEGREEGLGDAFMKHVVLYNNPSLTYISFDFHEHCRGLHFENVSVLVDSIRHDVIKDQRYCWVEGSGIILEQRGVFRVNCMDCLDRTNVVQTAFARTVLTTQLHKVGMLMPDEPLPEMIKAAFQDMWANNGDALSHTYTGTAALKGDFTRTGERKFTGLMKDGYHSANRYYTAQFKDAYRQLTVDILLGNKDTLEEKSLLADQLEEEDETDVWTKEREEVVQQLIQHCVRLLVPKLENRVYLGGWALISCDSGDGNDVEDDIILLVTEEAYYIANYDDENEKITQYERIPMKDMEAITIGSATTFFGSSEQRCCRIHHTLGEEPGYFITLKDLPGHTKKQIDGTLQGVIQSFAIARAANNLGLKVVEGEIKSMTTKESQNVVRLTSQKRISMWFQDKLTRDKGDPGRGSTHPIVNHNRHPGITSLQLKPATVQQVGKYIQTVGNRVSGLSLLKKIKLRKLDSDQSSFDGIENAAFEDVTKESDDDAIDGGDEDVILGEVVEDSTSTDTSSSSMSIGAYLDLCTHVDTMGNFDDSLVTDGDINIPRVGDLATDPVRNSRSFSYRGVTPKKRHSMLEYGNQEKTPVRAGKGGSHMVNRFNSQESGGGELKRSNTQEDLTSSPKKTTGNMPSVKDILQRSPSKRGKSNKESPPPSSLSISVTTDEIDGHKPARGNELTSEGKPKSRRVHSLAVGKELLAVRSPVKSHSENNLLDLSEMKGAELNKAKENSESSEVSSGGSGFRRLTNQFRKFNLPISFTRTQRQNEKLKHSLEMRAQCQSRFICL